MNALTLSTPALLFPAVSLLFLAYTNRFLHIASLIREIHRDWVQRRDDSLHAQIENLRRRLAVIRWMQILGAVSILLCVVAMVSVMLGLGGVGWVAFFAALLLMAASLACLVVELWWSGGALHILLNRLDRE